MLNVRYSTKFKKDFKLAKKRGLPMHELELLASRTGTHSDLFQ